MSGTHDEAKPPPSAPAPDKQDDRKDAAELEKLDAKLARLNRQAEMLNAAMQQKPNKEVRIARAPEDDERERKSPKPV